MNKDILPVSFQALELTAAAWIRSQVPSRQPGTALYIRFHHSTAQCIGYYPVRRVIWLMAWTTMLCVLGMLAFGVDIGLPQRSPSQPKLSQTEPD